MKNRYNMGSKVGTKLNIPWRRQKASLEAHLGKILGPCCAKSGPKLGQVGARLGQVGAKLGQVGANMVENGGQDVQDRPRWWKMKLKRAKIGQHDRNWEKNKFHKLRRNAPRGLTRRLLVFANLQHLQNLVRIGSWIQHSRTLARAPDPVALRAISPRLGYGDTAANN